MSTQESVAQRPLVVIAGYAPGLGSSLATRLLAEGYQVAALGRRIGEPARAGFHPYAVALDQADAVAAAFTQLDAIGAPLAGVIHNPAHLVIAPFLDTQLSDFQACWQSMVQTAILVSQAAVPRMLAQAPLALSTPNQPVRGRMIFSGATASVRGGARFGAFASAKFALRGLVQSLAREYQNQGIHIAHVLLDGIIWSEKSRQRHQIAAEQCLLPEDIAQCYLQLLQQPPSTWTQELDLRPAGEKF